MISRETIQQLKTQLSKPTLSLYLRVDPAYQQNQAEMPAWRIWLKNALRDIAQEQPEEKQEQWKMIQDRLTTWIDQYEPQGKTLILFLDQENLFDYELPVALENHASYDEVNFMPLLWSIDEYERYLIVLVDQEQARLMSAYLGGTAPETEMSIDLDYDWGEKTLMPASAKGGQSGGRALREGNNRDRFEDMIEAHVDRFHQDVADEIREIFSELNEPRIIIGGAERAAHNVQSKLHESITPHVVSILPIPFQAPEDEIYSHVLDAGLHFEREREKDLVDQVIGFAKAGGRGALGMQAVNRAFTMQQVELLILPYPPTEEGQVSDLMHKAMELNSDVELVHGEPADLLRNEGGVAARLYYSIETS